MKVNSIDSWGTIAIGSSVLCFNNLLDVLTTNTIIDLINAGFQVLISVSTLLLCYIKIKKELKNEKKSNKSG